MNLLETFLRKLAKKGVKTQDIRFLDVEENLRTQIGQMSISEYSKKHSVNSGTLSHMLKGRRAIPLNLIKLNDYNVDLKCIVSNCNIPIRIPSKLTKELAYLLGALRDGTVTEEKDGEYCCAFYSMNRDYIDSIRDYIKKLFDVQNPIRRFGDVFGMRIRSKTMFLFFTLVFGATNDQSKWNTPKLIKNSNLQIKKAYISGFWDAEGGIPHLEKYSSMATKNLYIKFVQKSMEPLGFIKNVLNSNKIETGNVYYEKDKHVLKIKKSSFRSFSRFIQPLHPAKLKRLDLLTRLLP